MQENDEWAVAFGDRTSTDAGGFNHLKIAVSHMPTPNHFVL